jgi:integrase
VAHLHVVSKRRKTGTRWYVYAWRGGPCITVVNGARPVIGPDLLSRAMAARAENIGVPANTFDQLITDYRASPEFSRLAASTQRDYRLWLDRLSVRFGTAALGAFEDQRMRREIILWRDTWADRPRSADKASVMMATVLGWAVDNGLLAVNVAARIRQLHHVNKADQVWEDRHWQAMAAKDDEGKPISPAHLMDALQLALLTGLRLGDLVALDWDHVGEKAIILTTKKRKGRAVIPILPELRAHLDSREHRTGAVLRNSRGNAWTESGLGTIFQRAKPTGFDRTIHDLRGTYATWLAIKGLTDDEIARIIGWTSRRVSEIRARYVDEARVVISLIERLSA